MSKLISLSLIVIGFVLVNQNLWIERPWKIIIFDYLANLSPLPQNDEELAAYREKAKFGHTLNKVSLDGLKTREFEIPTRASHTLPAKSYVPDSEGLENLPLVVFFHGGGMVLLGNGSHEGICADIARQSQAAVIAVDYRLAPETKFPGQIEDAYDSTLWIQQHAKEFQGDPQRIIVAGDSAGGKLAATVTIMAKNQKFTPPIAYQILMYPSVGSIQNTESAVRYAKGYVLSAEQSRWFGKHYLNEKDRDHPLIAPANVKDLSGLPPTLIQVAEWDILRDAAIQYGKTLESNGVKVTVTQLNETIHGYLSMGFLFPITYQLAMDEIVRHVKQSQPIP